MQVRDHFDNFNQIILDLQGVELKPDEDQAINYFVMLLAKMVEI